MLFSVREAHEYAQIQGIPMKLKRRIAIQNNG